MRVTFEYGKSLADNVLTVNMFNFQMKVADGLKFFQYKNKALSIARTETKNAKTLDVLFSESGFALGYRRLNQANMQVDDVSAAFSGLNFNYNKSSMGRNTVQESVSIKYKDPNNNFSASQVTKNQTVAKDISWDYASAAVGISYSETDSNQKVQNKHAMSFQYKQNGIGIYYANKVNNKNDIENLNLNYKNVFYTMSKDKLSSLQTFRFVGSNYSYNQTLQSTPLGLVENYALVSSKGIWGINYSNKLNKDQIVNLFYNKNNLTKYNNHMFGEWYDFKFGANNVKYYDYGRVDYNDMLYVSKKDMGLKYGVKTPFANFSFIRWADALTRYPTEIYAVSVPGHNKYEVVYDAIYNKYGVKYAAPNYGVCLTERFFELNTNHKIIKAGFKIDLTNTDKLSYTLGLDYKNFKLSVFQSVWEWKKNYLNLSYSTKF
jgi:hypothetical protein